MIPPPKESARMVFEQEMIWAVCHCVRHVWANWDVILFLLWKQRVEWGSKTIGITYYHILSICIYIYIYIIYIYIHDLFDNEDVGFHPSTFRILWHLLENRSVGSLHGQVERLAVFRGRHRSFLPRRLLRYLEQEQLPSSIWLLAGE